MQCSAITLDADCAHDDHRRSLATLMKRTSKCNGGGKCAIGCTSFSSNKHANIVGRRAVAERLPAAGGSVYG